MSYIFDKGLDYAAPFVDGYATYYIGGEPIYEDGRTRAQIIKEDGTKGLMDKHWYWGGDIIEVGYLDNKGNRHKTLAELNTMNYKKRME